MIVPVPDGTRRGELEGLTDGNQSVPMVKH